MFQQLLTQIFQMQRALKKDQFMFGILERKHRKQDLNGVGNVSNKIQGNWCKDTDVRAAMRGA